MENQSFFKWQPEDVFSFNGKDFSLLYNLLENITQTPQFQERLYNARETMQTVSLHDLVRSKLQEGVKSGIVKEVTKEEHDSMMAEAVKKSQEIQS